RVDSLDAAARDGAAHQCRVDHVRCWVVGRVKRLSGDLEPTVHPGHRLTGGHCGGQRAGHGRPGTFASCRSTGRLISSTLNPFSVNGLAPSAECDAASRQRSALAVRPINACSTVGSRPGTVATPPPATRAARTVPATTLSATAAEAIANSNDSRSRTFR